jgi:hypothetical protein
MMKGAAPAALRFFKTPLTISGRLAMPRLPTATAMRAPAFICERTCSNSIRSVCGMSNGGPEAKFCLAAIMRGKELPAEG